jgi:hypothetical protein
MFNTKGRIIELERRLDMLERERKCAAGSHEWELYTYYRETKPTIRCAHCYHRPDEKEKK